MDKRITEFLETHTMDEVKAPTYGYMFSYQASECEYLYGNYKLIVFENGATKGKIYTLE